MAQPCFPILRAARRVDLRPNELFLAQLSEQWHYCLSAVLPGGDGQGYVVLMPRELNQPNSDQMDAGPAISFGLDWSLEINLERNPLRGRDHHSVGMTGSLLLGGDGAEKIVIRAPGNRPAFYTFGTGQISRDPIHFHTAVTQWSITVPGAAGTRIPLVDVVADPSPK